MARARSFASLAALAVIVVFPFAPSARAAGVITDLTASPSPAQVGAPVTVTVQGSGSCKELQVDFGDGTPPVPLASADLTKKTNVTTPPHAYTAAKTYSLKAVPVKDCSGGASASLVVGASVGKPPPPVAGSGQTSQATGLGGGLNLSKLCVLLGGCVPTVTSKIGLVTPGATMLLLGSGFGSAPGKATLQGQFGTREMKIVDWHPKGIGCVIPGDIAGVPDHTASVTVQNSGGAKSGAFPVAFEAAKVVKLLIAGDFSTVSCASTALINSCNWTVKVSGGSTATNEPWTGCVFKRSLCGWHQDGLSLAGFPSGTDTYEVTLKNGWTLHDKAPLSSGSLYTAHLADEPGGFVEGATHWKPSVKWWMNKYLWTTYTMDVFAIGPKGVPSK